MKAYYRILGIVFALIIFIMSITSFALPKDTFSDLENRVLAKMPSFSYDSFVEGRYSSKVETYVNDHFPFRSNFVTLKSSFDSILGKKEINGVYLGENGYLLEEIKKPNVDFVNTNIKAINEFTNKHKDINTTFLLAPNASSVLRDYLPTNAINEDGVKNINEFSTKLNENIKFINPYENLSLHKDEYLYYKTDHHWTTLGAYYAYEDYCNANKIEINSLDEYNKEKVSSNFYGTLFSKTLAKDNEGDEINVYIPKKEDSNVVVEYITEKQKTTSLYSGEYLEKRDQYGMFLKGNHPIVKIQTTAKLEKEKKLLIIKDSYANSFVPFLTSHYSEITLVDPRYYYDDIETLMEQDKYTDILFLYNANTFFQDNSLNGVLIND